MKTIKIHYAGIQPLVLKGVSDEMATGIKEGIEKDRVMSISFPFPVVILIFPAHIQYLEIFSEVPNVAPIIGDVVITHK